MTSATRREDRGDVGQRECDQCRTHHVVPPLDDDGHERHESEIDRNDGENRPERAADDTGETQQRRGAAETDGHHQAARRLPYDDVGVVHEAGPNRVR